MSTTCGSNNFNLSIKMHEEAIAPQFMSKPPRSIPLPKKTIVKQGIVSILGSESERGKTTTTSIRRTFSADMSSKQWLAQNGFSYPMKRIGSSKDLVHSSLEKPKISDVWSTILSQKKENDTCSNLETPYIHPLVKRSTSSLSEKSLEICTENLGSETGSDGFSSYSPSEVGDVDQEEKDDQQQQKYCSHSYEEMRVVKYNYDKRLSYPKSFPPPIPSLDKGDNKPCVHMQSRREDGRFILEAISLPSRNIFCAQRHEGRLLLTFIDHDEDLEEVSNDNEGDEDNQTPQFDHDIDDCLEEKRKQEKEDHMGLGNKNLATWSNKFNKTVNLTGSVGSTELVEELTEIPPLPRSLPTFNACEYVWRKKPTIAKQCSISSPCLKNKYLEANITTPKAKSTTSMAANEKVLIRGSKKENMKYLVPMQRGCKESRRSLLSWEPYNWIATS